jgi:dihydroorotate dehydrogenase
MQIGNYELDSPLINAGGVVKSVEDVRLMAQTAVGAVLAGSYTLEPRAGNSPNGETVYFHDTCTGTTYNSLGMPNKGMEAVAAELQEMIDIAHDHGKPFILNFAPVTDNPVGEVNTLAEILARAKVEELDAIELNASCPNVVTPNGGRHELLSHHPKLLAEVLFELSDISVNEVPFKDLLVRISPFREKADVGTLTRRLQEVGVSAVSAFNTFPGGKPLDKARQPILQVPGGIGGQSGAGMRSAAERQTTWLAEANGNFEIIGSNGIIDGRSMKRRLDIGATAVSASTLFYEAENWGRAVDRVLREYEELAA